VLRSIRPGQDRCDLEEILDVANFEHGSNPISIELGDGEL
jgi:hypothetical protein